MLRSSVVPLAALLFVLSASNTYAAPIYFSIGRCAQGDCASFNSSGQGSILAQLDLVNGNDLLITLTNRLNADAHGDDPHLTNLGFEYGSLLSGLSFDSFSVLSGNVIAPTFSVDSAIKSFYIDFGFGFSQSGSYSLRDGRFQAHDPNEVVQILVGTTGAVDLDKFNMGVAKVGGVGENGTGGSVILTGVQSASVPEPGSLALVLLGAGAATARRKLRHSRKQPAL